MNINSNLLPCELLSLSILYADTTGIKLNWGPVAQKTLKFGLGT
jgi:hypothetical protein